MLSLRRRPGEASGERVHPNLARTTGDERFRDERDYRRSFERVGEVL